MFRKQQGVATLLITVIMLASITLIILAAASHIEFFPKYPSI
jgi:hypothetical protein